MDTELWTEIMVKEKLLLANFEAKAKALSVDMRACYLGGVLVGLYYAGRITDKMKDQFADNLKDFLI